MQRSNRISILLLGCARAPLSFPRTYISSAFNFLPEKIYPLFVRIKVSLSSISTRKPFLLRVDSFFIHSNQDCKELRPGVWKKAKTWNRYALNHRLKESDFFLSFFLPLRFFRAIRGESNQIKVYCKEWLCFIYRRKYQAAGNGRNHESDIFFNDPPAPAALSLFSIAMQQEADVDIRRFDDRP